MTKKSWSLIALSMIAAVVLVMTAGGPALGVAVDGYLSDEITLTGVSSFALTSKSPGAGACPGEQVCIEGKAWMLGTTAGDADGDGDVDWADLNGNGIMDPGEFETVVVEVAAEGEVISIQLVLLRQYNVGDAPTQDVRYEVDLGSAVVDAAGNFSVCGTLPTSVTRTSDYTLVDTPAGDWTVVVNTQNSGNAEIGFMTVLDCGQAPEPGMTTVAGVAVAGGRLPSTGFPVAIASVVAGLMTTTGVGIRMWRRGR